MAESFFKLPRRMELINRLNSRPKSLSDHKVRIRYELGRKEEAALAGAITDFYIQTTKEEFLDRLDVLKESMDILSSDWILLFYDYLQEDFSEITPLPYNHWSIFTEDVQGSFDFVRNPFTDDSAQSDRLDK